MERWKLRYFNSFEFFDHTRSPLRSFLVKQSRESGVRQIRRWKWAFSFFEPLSECDISFRYGGPPMEPSLQALELRRKQLHRQMENLGDFRRGTISVNYRKCGKSNCACARKGHPGHGPQYLWNASVSGKTQAQNLPLGPELEKVEKEVERYRSFVRLCQEMVEVNAQICQLRPARTITDEDELEELKKKLQKRFVEKRNKR